MPRIAAVSGLKNSGKTTLITKLVTYLSTQGYRIGVIKHDGHDFDADVPGTDSYRHKQAGAELAAVFSESKISMVMNTSDATIEYFLPFCKELDVVLLEGFKYSDYPKIEVVRAAVSSQPVCRRETLLAVATDCRFLLQGVPVVGLDDVERMTEYILALPPEENYDE